MSDFSWTARCRKHNVTFAPDDGGCPGCEDEREMENRAWHEFINSAHSVVYNSDNAKREELCIDLLNVYFENRDIEGHLYHEQMAKDLEGALEKFGIKVELERSWRYE